MYWKHLKISGSMYIDDISWLPYLKNNWRDHEYTENINKDTFQKLLDIMLTNNDNIIMEFIFNGSGMCRITKLENKPLSEPKYIKSRNNFFKKLIKKITNIKN